ncbi:MAG: hypothetical protein OER92_05450 [Alphaproteobacteria bacterium]|nr:hypothetical protein [Alphaproteobacteria bacterium]
MAHYSIGDRVTLAPARGGYEGFVTSVLGGPGGAPLYLVQSSNSGDPNEGITLAAEVDIASGPGPVPVFTLGDTVTLYDAGGIVTASHGDDTYDVAVDWVPTQHLTLTRSHLAVPAWRLALENGG